MIYRQSPRSHEPTPCLPKAETEQTGVGTWGGGGTIYIYMQTEALVGFVFFEPGAALRSLTLFTLRASRS